VSVPLEKPMQMSHVILRATGNVLVRLESDTGHVGWGEGVEAMDVTGENQARITASIEAFRPRLIGEDPRRRTAIWSNLSSSAYGNSTAIGAVDIALHDLVGQAFGVPVVDLIGGVVRHEVPALTLLGSGNTDVDVATFQDRYRSGFRWFKLKLGIGAPEAEAETLRRIAGHAGDVVACGDANAAWSEAQSARFLRMVDDLPVRFIEQPTRDHAAMARLSAKSPVAICADEGCRSLAELPLIASSGLAGVSLKLIKHGGITGVMRGAAICDNLGLSINLAGKVAETSIAAAANVHCAAAMADTYFGCSPGNQGISADVTPEPMLPVEGIYEVPTKPGLGIEVDEEMVRALM
jgi:muconate cycloisomerase